MVLALSACGTTEKGTSPEAEMFSLAGVDGNDLYLNVVHGACDTFDHTDVRESRTEVAVAVIHATRNVDCVSMALSECRVVTLQAPLGDRRLVYASPFPVPNNTGAPVPAVAPHARTSKPVDDPGTLSTCARLAAGKPTAAP
jgi:hypothetical protein